MYPEMFIYVGQQQYHHSTNLSPTIIFCSQNGWKVWERYWMCVWHSKGKILHSQIWFKLLKWKALWYTIKNSLCFAQQTSLGRWTRKTWMEVKQAQEEDRRHKYSNQLPAMLLQLDSLFVEHSNSTNNDNVPYQVPV